jgi:hypothetical protein
MDVPVPTVEAVVNVVELTDEELDEYEELGKDVADEEIGIDVMYEVLRMDVVKEYEELETEVVD